ncbi:LLM class flavin-dependent oxidoreductase [Pullulanibacillus sp. KACC 23026]|uniref:LLM class flavin-dependent oxidoreductase n=1 Tax=Pullulanibacillus sp. KACC 23026 TaxID=3028315 RepID=UPI0023AF3154|nr:LLM class flavin-dependent oxidoreductase [Pullulanibacillus sp. KACC 23026]WEG13722.1 LLM class flavin-dependent oxidoreductase [Pullulanibacillus sp. KACC 23026]
MTTNQSNTSLKTIKRSVLDLAPILSGQTARDALHNSLNLAQATEQSGYTRYWVAEHHNMPGIASSATAVLIGYLAGGTKTIRVGSGGIMLPNHAPLIVAEQFGTLESLYPGRIDLGLGRAPGTDQLTSMALRRDLRGSVNDFPDNVQELISYFKPETEGARVRAIPGEGLHVPIWLLGSSTFSAQLAGMLGLPFAFASHFAPQQLSDALYLYRHHFTPSAYLEKPYVMAGVNVIAAETDEKAEYLASSLYQSFLGIIRGSRSLLQPPVENMAEHWNPIEEAHVREQLQYTFVGGPETIHDKLEKFTKEAQVDEIIIASNIYDQEARIKSYQIVAEQWN